MPWHPPTGKTWTKGPYRGMPAVLVTSTTTAIADPMQIDRIMIALQTIITNHLHNGDNVSIPRFGTFYRIHNTRKILDPDTGIRNKDPQRLYYIGFRPLDHTRNTIAKRVLA